MKTNILMIVISAALVIVMSFILIFVFSLSNPDGIKRLTMTARDVFSGTIRSNDIGIYYFIAWAFSRNARADYLSCAFNKSGADSAGTDKQA